MHSHGFPPNYIIIYFLLHYEVAPYFFSKFVHKGGGGSARLTAGDNAMAADMLNGEKNSDFFFSTTIYFNRIALKN